MPGSAEYKHQWYLQNKARIIEKNRANKAKMRKKFWSELVHDRDFLANLLKVGIRILGKKGYNFLHKGAIRVYEHQLVWIYHNGLYDKGKYAIHHLNEIKTDNRIENLKLVTKIQHSRIHQQYAHITDDMVIEGLKSGKTYRELSKELGCTHGLICGRLRHLKYRKNV